jgi:mono/diheme cytochrome c family protein
VKHPNLVAMQPAELLEQLRSPERWTRYQAKRLLFDAPPKEVLKAADDWLAKLTPTDPDYERLLLEAIGIFEGHETARPELLGKLLAAKDPRVRAYGTRVAGAWAEQLPEILKVLEQRVRDENPRVRLEAVVAASYVPKPEAVQVVTAALNMERDPFLDYAIRQSARALQPQWASALSAKKLTFGGSATQEDYLRKLAGTPPSLPSPGESIYEMACLPCHQPEGKGLPGVYPPLAGSQWVRGDSAPLIKVLLHGLTGRITVAGQDFGGANAVPMPSLAGLADQQIADVLTFVRKEFGAHSPAISPDDVKKVRAANANREGPWTVEELKQ